jgi:hypothetical protein
MLTENGALLKTVILGWAQSLRQGDRGAATRSVSLQDDHDDPGRATAAQTPQFWRVVVRSWAFGPQWCNEREPVRTLRHWRKWLSERGGLDGPLRRERRSFAEWF